MKKRTTLIIIALLLAVVAVAIAGTVAWMNKQGDDRSQEISIGIFDISLQKPFEIRSGYVSEGGDNYVGPGENIMYFEDPADVWAADALRVVNKSNIPVSLRVKIEYSRWNGVSMENNIVYSGVSPADDDFTVAFGVPADWTYDSGYWYYKGGNIPAVDFNTNPDGETYTLINSLSYNENILPGSDYEEKTVKVKLLVEAKQAEYATWAQVSP